MKKIYYSFLCLFILSMASYSQITINEYSASNVSYVYERDFYNFPSWIELYNAGGADVDLNGYFLTDSRKYPSKWTIPDTSIKAGGYLIFWADGMNTGMHTNFKLDADGEFLGLYNTSLSPLDSFSFLEQRPNLSKGRTPDGSGTWKLFGKPTPGSSNITAAADTHLTKPIFSIKGGFYNSSQSLVLSSVSGTASIYYTLDGSEPADTSTLYTSPITINKNTIVRARAYENGFAPSNIATHTYFYNETSTISVVSVVIPPKYLWNDTIGFYVNGENGVLYPIDGINNYDRDWERAGNVEIFNPNDTAVINTYCGIEIQGGTSRGRPQKSLDIKIRDQYGQDKVGYNLFSNRKYDNIHSFLLSNSGNDWSDGGTSGGYGIMFRDALIQTFPQGQMDVDVMSTRPAILFLNGQYWGIQNIREKMDKYYCNNNFPLVDKDSVSIIKQVPENNFELVEGDSVLLKNFIAWVKANDLSSDVTFKKVRDSVDLREFVNYVIVESYSNNIDWPHTGGNKMNNVKLWRQPGVSKWRWMLFDLDFGFNGFGVSWESWEKNSLDGAYKSQDSNPYSSILLKSFMTNKTFKNDFAQTVAAHLNTTYAKTRVDKVIDSLEAIFKPEIQRHINRWGALGSTSSMSNWNLHMSYTHNFTNQRMPFYWSHLKSLVGMSSMASVKIRRVMSNMGMVYIHGATMYNSEMKGSYFNNIPIELKAEPNQGFYFLRWEIKQGGKTRYSTNAFLIDSLKASGSLDSIFYTAIFSDSPEEAFLLTVNSGVGTGVYIPGAKVNITANAAPNGKTFDKWTGDVSILANVNSASTSLTMPNSNVTLTATYKIGSENSEETLPIVQLYPNPAVDQLEILLEEPIEGSIKVYDLTGTLKGEHAVHSNFANINVSQLSSGIYILSIQSEGKTINRKFIKE